MDDDHLFDGRLDTSQLVRLDLVCKQFDEHLRQGTASSIEHYLGDADGGYRSELLRQLLLTELEHREPQDSQGLLDEYLTRFPEERAACPRRCW